MQEADIGTNVTLKCFLSLSADYDAITWFRLNIGEVPHFVGRFHRFLPPAFSNEFNNSKRFNLSKGSGSFMLSIADIQPSDESSYFCGIIQQYGNFHFGSRTYLIVKGMGGFHFSSIVLKASIFSVKILSIYLLTYFN